MRQFLTIIASSLALLVVMLAAITPAAACSIHDHGCRFHGMGLTALPGGIDQNTNNLTAVLGWDTPGDLDIHGLLPADNGPYVVAPGNTGNVGSTTSLGHADREGEPFIGAGEHPRHIYYSQSRITFQNGDAVANITLDSGSQFNASTNPNGECAIGGQVSCEAITITGNNLPLNVPFTFQAYNFNDDDHYDPDPSANYHMRAYATGRYVIVQDSHIGGVHGNLANTGDSSEQLSITLGLLANAPHARGVALDQHDRLRLGALTPDVLQGFSVNTNDIFEGFKSPTHPVITSPQIVTGNIQPQQVAVQDFDIVNNQPQNQDPPAVNNGRIQDQNYPGIYWHINPSSGQAYPFLNENAGVKDKFQYGVYVAGGTLEEINSLVTGKDFYIGMGKAGVRDIRDVGNLVILSNDLKPKTVLTDMGIFYIKGENPFDTVGNAFANLDAREQAFNEFTEENFRFSPEASNDAQSTGGYVINFASLPIGGGGAAGAKIATRVVQKAKGLVKSLTSKSDEALGVVKNLANKSKDELTSLLGKFNAKFGNDGRIKTASLGKANKARLIDEVAASGKKITPENVVGIRKLSDGRTVWLETGSDTAGLRHIYKRHEVDFANKGISRAEVPNIIMNALEKGNIVGTNGSVNVYRITSNGVEQNIAIGIGSNGFIVRANPVSIWKPLP
jgi:hypothetical protein